MGSLRFRSALLLRTRGAFASNKGVRGVSPSTRLITSVDRGCLAPRPTNSTEVGGGGCLVLWPTLQRGVASSGYGMDRCDSGTDSGTAGAGGRTNRGRGTGYGGKRERARHTLTLSKIFSKILAPYGVIGVMSFRGPLRLFAPGTLSRISLFLWAGISVPSVLTLLIFTVLIIRDLFTNPAVTARDIASALWAAAFVVLFAIPFAAFLPGWVLVAVEMYWRKWIYGTLAGFAPYTETEWEQDERQRTSGFPLTCPDCRKDADYGPRRAAKADGSLRKYRACKMCGFWQEADGRSLPYRCRLAVHMCTGDFGTRRECRCCGNVQSGGTHRHLCPRALVPRETYYCPECHVSVGRRNVIPWPSRR